MNLIVYEHVAVLNGFIIIASTNGMMAHKRHLGPTIKLVIKCVFDDAGRI